MAVQKAKGSRGVIATNFTDCSTKRVIESCFRDIGPISRCNLVRDKDGVFQGTVYIAYTTPEDAARAVSTLDSTMINGNIISVKHSGPKKTKMKKKKKREAEHQRGANAVTTEEQRFEVLDIKTEKLEEGYGDVVEPEVKPETKPEVAPTHSYNNKRELPKRSRKKSKKDCCVIVRNLSFQVNEKIIEDHFAQCGKVTEVSILRREDGRMVGCAFVHYSTKEEAFQAIKECNMQPLLGRPVAVDLYVPKAKFAPATVKEEVKEEPDCDVGDDAGDEMQDVKDEEMAIEDNAEGGDDDWGDSGVEYDDDDGDDEEDYKPEIPKPKNHRSQDVAEGRTLFMKNLPFDATEEDVVEVLQKFGTVKYINFCIDRATEHPRGTAFAQFQTREAADACLAAEADAATKPDFILYGRPMHIMRAITRKEIDQRKIEKEKRNSKDTRNIYLAREGFVRPGTRAAEGLSTNDLGLRTRRERVKRQTLQNFDIFVSKTRLCVFNIPMNVDDQKLLEIFKKHSPEGAKITESRIMRNLWDLDETGKGKSRGYGFISFTEHEHALQALRNVNNNPDIFTSQRRPVVEFSLENKTVLKAREKRMEKSREKNPLWKKTKSSTNENNDDSSTSMVMDSENIPNFMGAKSDPKNKTLPANFGPKERHRNKGKISRNQYRREKREQKQGKKRKRPHNTADGSSPKKKARRDTEIVGKKMRKRPEIEGKRRKGKKKGKNGDKQQQKQLQHRENWKKFEVATRPEKSKKWYQV